MKYRKQNYQLLIIEFFIYGFTMLVFTFINKGLFFSDRFLNGNNSLPLFSLLFIFTIIGLGLFLYYDYKYNHLKLKNIFLYIGLAIFLLSLESSIALPSIVQLPNNATISITYVDRIYSILYGFCLGLLPYLFFYVCPRRLRYKKYIEFVILCFIIFVSISVFASAIMDFNNIVYTLRNKFSDFAHPAVSFFVFKNVFGRILFIGICSSIYMHIYTNRKIWLLLLIPYFLFSIFTFAKMTILLNTLIIFIYFFVRFFKYFTMSRDNIFIFIIISFFILTIISILCIFISKSNFGLFNTIKKLFISFFDNAKATFSSRIIIWDCTFKILSPIHYVFGFSFTLIGNAIHFAYAKDPRCPEDPSNIWTAHNSIIEMIGQGGIPFLLINIFFAIFIVYISIKVYKVNQYLSIINIIILFMIIIQGLTDSIMFFGEGENLFFTALISLPILGEYYSNFDKNEIKNTREIIHQANIIANKKFNSKILKLNKKRILFEKKMLLNDSKEILN